MKKYNKPVIEVEQFLSFENISNLSDWLEGYGNEYIDAGITTYVVES